MVYFVNFYIHTFCLRLQLYYYYNNTNSLINTSYELLFYVIRTSAAMLRDRLLCDKDKQKWDGRDEYKKIVMFDWHTEEKTPTPGSTLHILKNIFLKVSMYRCLNRKVLNFRRV